MKKSSIASRKSTGSSSSGYSARVTMENPEIVEIPDGDEEGYVIVNEPDADPDCSGSVNGSGSGK